MSLLPLQGGKRFAIFLLISFSMLAFLKENIPLPPLVKQHVLHRLEPKACRPMSLGSYRLESRRDLRTANIVCGFSVCSMANSLIVRNKGIIKPLSVFYGKWFYYAFGFPSLPQISLLNSIFQLIFYLLIPRFRYCRPFSSSTSLGPFSIMAIMKR